MLFQFGIEIQMFQRNLLPASSGFLNLEMEVAESFKMVTTMNQNTRCHVVEDRNLKVTIVSTSHLQSHCLISNYRYTHITVYIVYVSQVWYVNDGYHYKACNI